MICQTDKVKTEKAVQKKVKFSSLKRFILHISVRLLLQLLWLYLIVTNKVCMFVLSFCVLLTLLQIFRSGRIKRFREFLFWNIVFKNRL